MHPCHLSPQPVSPWFSGYTGDAGVMLARPRPERAERMAEEEGARGAHDEAEHAAHEAVQDVHLRPRHATLRPP